MTDHLERGYARTALFTLTTSTGGGDDVVFPRGGQEFQGPWILGLWTEDGDGIALEGTSKDILHYLRRAVAYVERATKQEGLPGAFGELVDLREQRSEAAARGEDVDDYNAREVQLMRWIAEASAQLLEYQSRWRPEPMD
jgi:hypothetical protein